MKRMKFITGKQFNSLVSLPGTQLRNDIKIPQDNRSFYLLKDGRLLAFSDSIPDRVQVFESVDEYKKIIAIVMSDIEESPTLEKFKNLLEQVPENIQFCKEALGQELAMNPELLDYSPGSFKLIDKKIRDTITRQDYFNKVYGYLLVYFGEAVRRQVNGKWGKRTLAGVIEPFILSEEKNEIQYCKALHEQASEDFKKFSTFREFKVVTSS